MSCSSGEERRDSDQPEFHHDELYRIPLIILSSSEDLQQGLHSVPKPKLDPQELKLIQQKREAEMDKMRRIHSIKQEWNQITVKQKEVNQPLKRQKSQNKQRDPKNEREFPQHHQFLSNQSLDFVREQMKAFSTHQQCRFEISHHLREDLVKHRQVQRQELTKFILLARQQLKTMKEKRTEFEQKICKDNLDILRYVYPIAKNIQTNFFNKLYNKSSHKKAPDFLYLKQIKLILREFKDRNNLELRRKILSKQYNIAELVTADEQSIMCDKSRQLQNQKQKQLVRESSKNFFEAFNPMDQQPPSEAHIQPGSLFPSFKSAGDFYEGKIQTLEEKRRREKGDLMAKNKIICKKTYLQISKVMKEMKERIRRLKQQSFNNHILKDVDFDFKWNI